MSDNNAGNHTNPDPITGEPGSHPIGTGVGSAGAGVTGAAIGAAVGGPVGAIVGGVIGSIAGGLGGKGVAEKVNPTTEDAYWRENHKNQPYAANDPSYEKYEPAYKYGWTARAEHAEGRFTDVEKKLETGWDTARGKSNMAWKDAKGAVSNAWHRVDNDPTT